MLSKLQALDINICMKKKKKVPTASENHPLMEVVTIKTDYGTERRYYRPRWISTALRISGILFFSFSFVYSFFIHLANLYQVTTVCNVLFIALGLTKINWIKLCAQRPFIDLVERHCMG